MEEQEELTECVRCFFEDYLNIRDESDSGKVFAPVFISCCRASKLEKLNILLERMRVLSGSKIVSDL